MLEVKGLEAGYGALPVLRGIDFAIEPGEIVAVLGSNGAGKSTLNNTLSGLLRPSAGRIAFLGTEIAGATPQSIVSLGLIQVPEGRRVFPTLTVRENLEMGSYRRGRANRARNIERVTAIFPRLRERMGQYAGTLSWEDWGMFAKEHAGTAEKAARRELRADRPGARCVPRKRTEYGEGETELKIDSRMRDQMHRGF